MIKAGGAVEGGWKNRIIDFNPDDFFDEATRTPIDLCSGSKYRYFMQTALMSLILKINY